MMKNLFSVIALVASSWAMAAGPAVHLDKAPIDLTDKASLQNGARLFQNYCLGCHQMQYQRYSRTFSDLDIPEEVGMENLMFTGEKVGDHITNNMSAKDGEKWFGATPPDLTLIARSRAGHNGTGADYLYTYLRSYYRDDTKPTGWNNLAFPNVGMPNPLWELQGEREPVYEDKEEHGHTVQIFKGWKQVKPGTMTPLQYDQAIGDLVGYMQWMAEPAQNTRVRIGVWVLIFLSIFTFIAWRLNAAYWKDIK